MMAETKQSERRRHKRVDLNCPIHIYGTDGKVLIKGNTSNISDGGVLVYISEEDATNLEGPVRVRIAVPRSTENAYTLEEFTSQALLARRIGPDETCNVGLAFQFATPMHMGLQA